MLERSDYEAIVAAILSYRKGAPMSLQDIRLACAADGHPISHINNLILSEVVKKLCTSEERSSRSKGGKLYRHNNPGQEEIELALKSIEGFMSHDCVGVSRRIPVRKGPMAEGVKTAVRNSVQNEGGPFEILYSGESRCGTYRSVNWRVMSLLPPRKDSDGRFVMNRILMMDGRTICEGHWCAYIEVPYVYLDWCRDNLGVHGGLTFGDMEANGRTANQYPDGRHARNRFNVIGWDYAHAGDERHIYSIQEIERDVCEAIDKLADHMNGGE